MKICNVFKTIYGYAGISSIDGKLLEFVFPGETKEEALIKLNLSNDNIDPTDPLLNEISEKVCKYFLGDKITFSNYELDLSKYGLFQAKVIKIIQNLEYGKTITYKETAVLANSENSARAVGQTMARNRTPIIVPCHRVITSGNKLGGFSAGLDWKVKLLNLEGIML